ncbi:MAG: 50S ribosomal protein L10 [Dehalococcoidia bacterium]|nr:50S ribosomal protein L10 [Dehalococcoidia bacterium]
MTTKRKTELVEELTELLTRNRFIVATDYRGLSVSELSELRKQLRAIESEYHIVKNTLVDFAARNSGKTAIAEVLKGPTALAFSRKDIAQLTKTIMDYARVSKSTLSIKGMLVDNRLYGADKSAVIAALPPVEVMRARLVGALMGPVYALHTVLSANLRGLTNVLNARMQQLGG